MFDGADDGGLIPGVRCRRHMPRAQRRWWASLPFRVGLAVAALACAYGLARAQQTYPDSIPGGIFNTTPPTLSNFQRGTLQLDTNGNLKVVSTLTPGLALDSSLQSILVALGAPMQATGGTVKLVAGTAVIGHVICDSGCAAGAGTGANNADGVAGVATGLGQTTAYPFLWNGATFDRWYGDKTNGAFVNVKASVLPTGAALDATLQSILTKLNASIAVTGTFWQATQPVSFATLPLPAGASTDASLQSILAVLGKPLPIQGSPLAPPVNVQPPPVTNVSIGNDGLGMGCAGQSVSNTQTALINNAASSSALKIISKQPGRNIYICAINVGPVAAAVNVALVAGTLVTNACDTSTVGLMGGATAATGWQFGANGGLTMGNGRGIVAKTATTGLDACLLFSTGTQVSGVVTYAQF